jgi:hypothetical protein
MMYDGTFDKYGVAEPSKMDSEPHIWHDVGTLTSLTVALVEFFWDT